MLRLSDRGRVRIAVSKLPYHSPNLTVGQETISIWKAALVQLFVPILSNLSVETVDELSE